MRFISEFVITPDHPEIDRYANFLKSKHGVRIYEMINEVFGWQNPVHGNDLRYRLEIEAFEFDKWQQFKRDLLNYFISREAKKEVMQMIKQLEGYE